MRLPIRTRLTLVFAGLTLVVLATAAAALLIRFRAELAQVVDTGLRARAATILAAPGAPLDTSLGPAPADEAFAQLIGSDGHVIRTSGGIQEDPILSADAISSVGEGATFDVEVATTEDTIPARVLALPDGTGSVLIVGADVEDQREAVARLASLVIVGGPLVLVAMSLLAWILAGAALRPVERLRSEAAAISTTDPTRRLPVPETGDELRRLAETLNEMLDRLHEALDRERRFVDEASHELRTPLGVLTAEIGLALKEPRSHEELVTALASISEEADRLSRLTQDLLVLARSDRGRLPVHRADVDVTSIIERVAVEFEDRADREGVRLRISGSDVRARLDADRIRQAVENLVDNALRHAGPGGTVEVRAYLDGTRLRVVVSDSGSGFSRDLLDSVFEPFARGDGDREGDGAGLGLAIVRAVAEAHGGSATARNLEGGGASVSLDLPM